eukprot:gene19782-24021_t
MKSVQTLRAKNTMKKPDSKKPDINKSFYFIRHGQTDLNINGIAPRDLDLQVPINEEGKSQAARAAKLLKNK